MDLWLIRVLTCDNLVTQIIVESQFLSAEVGCIKHDLKRSSVKVLVKTFRQRVGPSSNWSLFVDHLTRGRGGAEGGGAVYGNRDDRRPRNNQPVFDDMRQNLQALGTQIADIRTAARITPRV